jgi:hypothetical protein
VKRATHILAAGLLLSVGVGLAPLAWAAEKAVDRSATTGKPAATAAKPSNPREETGTHPDGSLAFRVKLNAAGKRDGDYVGYLVGGNKVAERSRYKDGLLHGYRTTSDESGKLTADETWVKGKLVFPKSAKLIEATRQQIKAQTLADLKKSPPAVPKGGMTEQAILDALVKVRTYRYLCDVPYDVGLDNEYIDLCQHGSEVMQMIKELTHTPRRPEGVTDEFYEKGKAGCGRSNIYSGNSIVDSVDAYMDDSDASNIDRLGHRRWVLNPAMRNTGFGAGASAFSAMYSFDGKRKDVPDYEWVCFPPRGYYPAKEFKAGYAWHASFNPKKYAVAKGGVKMAIYPVDGQLNRASSPLELAYQNVDTGGFAIPNAVIAKPKALVLKPGAMYEVVVTGLKPKQSDELAEVSYYVAFY